MTIKVLNGLSTIKPQEWNALVPSDAPFLKYQFLQALELSGCVGGHSGWLPAHFVLHNALSDRGSPQKLIGAIPAYVKDNSYGEYVFDWAWARAYHQAGLNYYPKLLCAVPFTPVTGPRILVGNDADSADVVQRLAAKTLQFAREKSLSSVHFLFTPKHQSKQLSELGLMQRTGAQFHWRNQGYADFDDYLLTFSSKKRKNVKRERKSVAVQDIQFEWLSGDEITTHHWQTYYRFYRSTIDCRGAIPYLNMDFFRTLSDTLPKNVLLLLARQNDRYIAGAFFLTGDKSLYGRYWGSDGWYDGLHFETCYYQAIEYCIENKLERFEAGAQGEHKLSRGLMPVTTYSSHWLAHPQFARAVSEFLQDERIGVDRYQQVLQQHSPFKNSTE